MEAGAEQPSQPPVRCWPPTPSTPQTIPLGGGGGWKPQTPDLIYIYIYRFMDISMCACAFLCAYTPIDMCVPTHTHVFWDPHSSARTTLAGCGVSHVYIYIYTHLLPKIKNITCMIRSKQTKQYIHVCRFVPRQLGIEIHVLCACECSQLNML